MVVYHELVLFRMQISSIAETTNVSILHSEPRNFFQLEKYFRVVKRSSLSHRKQIRMCFLQEQFINVPSKASVQKKWPLLGFFLFSPRQEHKLIMLNCRLPSIPRVHRRSWRELFGDGCSNVWKWWGEVSAMNSNPFLLFLSFLLFQGSQHIGGKYCTIWCSSCFILELFPRLVPTWKIAGTPSDIHAWWRRKMFCTNVLVTVELHCQNLNLRSFNFWNFLTFIWEAILSARLFPRRRIVSKQNSR